ncbi:winged helix-turn-helix domain-containing protein [Aeromonas veronii]|jgi:molybdate transport system regulatory protein|uniref:winged helix-turn-helix domain-containing protein n=1 Tax=Aeromonas veronii TaxID=654 RepID=UPI0039F58F08
MIYQVMLLPNYTTTIYQVPMNTVNPKSQVILVRPRVYIGKNLSIGPGKIDLLRAIGEARSISAAARSMDLPYKRAWLLINTLNEGFPCPVVETATGGKGGGGASLTPLGVQLVEAYDALEKRLNSQASPELELLRQLTEPQIY